MYQSIFHGDDTRFRSLLIDYIYAPQHYVGLPQIAMADAVRQWANEALIALGMWIKPGGQSGQVRPQTTAWQRR